MYLLGLAFLAWIACGGLVLGYFVELNDQVSSLSQFAMEQTQYANRRIDIIGNENIDTREIMKNWRMELDRRIVLAQEAAQAAQASIDAHERWVEDQRRQNAAVIEKHRRAARGHNG